MEKELLKVSFKTNSLKQLSQLFSIEIQMKTKYSFIFSVFIVTWILAISLMYIEFWYFFNPDHTFKFVPDKEFSGFVDINVDMTVAMPCESKQIPL